MPTHEEMKTEIEEMKTEIVGKLKWYLKRQSKKLGLGNDIFPPSPPNYLTSFLKSILETKKGNQDISRKEERLYTFFTELKRIPAKEHSNTFAMIKYMAAHPLYEILRGDEDAIQSITKAEEFIKENPHIQQRLTEKSDENIFPLEVVPPSGKAIFTLLQKAIKLKNELIENKADSKEKNENRLFNDEDKIESTTRRFTPK